MSVKAVHTQRIPEIIALAAEKKCKEENLTFTNYMKLLIAESLLGPEAYKEFKLTITPSYVGESSRLYIELDPDMEAEYVPIDYVPQKKINFRIEDTMWEQFKEQAKQWNLAANTFLSIIIMKDLADEMIYICYRSMRDKKWLVEYSREQGWDNYAEQVKNKFNVVENF